MLVEDFLGGGGLWTKLVHSVTSGLSLLFTSCSLKTIAKNVAKINVLEKSCFIIKSNQPIRYH